MQISPWLARDPGASSIEYRGARFAADNGAAGGFSPPMLLDWSFRAALRCRGADARTWLNGIITANVRDLAPGHAAPSFFLNPKGHILAAFDVVCAAPDEFLILASEDQISSLLEALRRFIFRSRVEFEDLSATHLSLAVAGAGNTTALEAAGVSRLPIAAGQAVSLPSAGEGQQIAIRERLGEIDTIEICGALEPVMAVYDALARQATPMGVEAWDCRLLLEGVPRLGRDIREGILPPETGLMSAIGRNKGCYIGQEIVERIRARGQVHRQFRGFRFAGAVAAGDRIRAAGAEAGELTAVAALSAGPHAGQWAALGYLRREAEESRAALSTASGIAGELAAFPLDA